MVNHTIEMSILVVGRYCLPYKTKVTKQRTKKNKAGTKSRNKGVKKSKGVKKEQRGQV
jgi:hypothetical protein